MATPLDIIVCGSLVPDPLQTLEPVTDARGPALKNEQMLPSVLDPWAACALHEAAALAKTRPGSTVTLVSLGPRAKLQQLMMSVAQKAPFSLVAIDATASGFADAEATASALAAAIAARPGFDLSRTLLFGGCASASRDAGVVLQFVAEKLGITEFFLGVDRFEASDDDVFSVLERVEGGRYLSSSCRGLPLAVGWATGGLGEPPNNPQIGMMNMRSIMPALMKAAKADIGSGGVAWRSVETPSAKRDTVVKKDMSTDDIAKEIAAWLRA